jgi:hypothetical protein
MKRMAWWVVLVAGCFVNACSSDERENGDTRETTLSSCAVDTVIQHLLEGGSAADCGHLALGAGGDAVLAANRCAAEAHAAARPFWMTVEEVGIDSRVSSSYVGTEIDGRFTVLMVRYDSFGMAPNSANVQWYTCTSFEVASACEPGDGGLSSPVNPCISCTSDYRNFCECSPSTNRVSCGQREE